MKQCILFNIFSMFLANLDSDDIVYMPKVFKKILTFVGSCLPGLELVAIDFVSIATNNNDAVPSLT